MHPGPRTKQAFAVSEHENTSSRMTENKFFLLARNCFVEFIGLVIFVFIGSLQGSGGGQTGTVLPALAHGLTIFILVASMGHLSGGHYNPAVTLGVLVSGNIGIIASLLYVASQLTGGFVGALFVRAACNSTGMYVNEIGGGLTLPAYNYGIAQAIILEAVFTYMLVNTVLNAAVDNGGNTPLAPLAIGMTVAVDILAGGATSGASMNPARSFGPAVAFSMFRSSADKDPWRMHYIYWVGPILGALFAGLIYRTLLANKNHRWLNRVHVAESNSNQGFVDYKEGSSGGSFRSSTTERF